MYAKIIDGVVQKFPYTLADARAEYPNVSFPRNINDISEETLNSRDIYSVARLPTPSFNPATEKLVEGVPTLNGSVWEVQQVVVPLTAEELAARTQQEDTEALKADNQVTALLKARPAQINNYIDANVTNLAEAKAVLKILARAVSVLAQRTI